jgi:hypothetical protein
MPHGRPVRRRLGVIAALVVAVAAAAGGRLFLLSSASPSGAAGPPRYVDETSAAGIDHTYGGSFTFAVGGGLAAFDCSGDGRPELYLAGGEGPAALYRNDSPIGGALAFTRLRSATTDLTRVNGAYPLDIDGDSDLDLMVLRAGESELLRGLGDCRFESAAATLGMSGMTGMTEAFSATWEDEAGLPTLAFGNYRELDAAGEVTGGCAANLLIRPDASGRRYGPPIPLEPGYCVLSMLFSDWDRSGRRDLRVSNDRQYYDRERGEEQLWRMVPGEPPRRYTTEEGWVKLQIWGMGIASQDVTGDGYPELYLTTQGANKLQTLTDGPAQPTYADIGRLRAADAPRPFAGGDPLPSTAWHPEFADVNNDGLLDLFVSKGNVHSQVDYATRDPSNLMLGQPDGTFEEAADRAGILSFAKGRGAAVVDFNLDGLLDLVELNLADPVKLWRNVGSGDAAAPSPMGHWLALRIRQPGANADAIGAWVDIRFGATTVTRELVVGGGHVSGHAGWLHVGLGEATRADVRVSWPDGEVGPWLPVEADGFATYQRGSSGVEPWRPAP